MPDPTDLFRRAFAACPLVAVLRGITPAEIDAVADALIEAGFTILEVPLNSPDPYASIGRLAARHADRALVGAGTVLREEEVARVAQAGGRMIVSPSTDAGVIAATRSAGLVSLPGYFTPSEAFTALGAGAHGLKLFPAEGASTAYLKAQRAILPAEATIIVVGGVTPAAMPAWRAAGADGFGIGSNLYRPGKAAAEVRADAIRFVTAVRA